MFTLIQFLKGQKFAGKYKQELVHGGEWMGYGDRYICKLNEVKYLLKAKKTSI